MDSTWLILLLFGYLLGAIPNGLLIGRHLYGIDLREHGSKNIGATNAFRTLGYKPALLVFLTDTGKGICAVYGAMQVTTSPLILLSVGIAAIVGHNWSIFLHFKGGRGVATGLGIITVVIPKITIVVFLAWCLIVYFTRYVSLASIVGAALVPLLVWLMNEKVEYLYFGYIAATFVIVRHTANIKRLLSGTELKIKMGHASAPSDRR